MRPPRRSRPSAACSDRIPRHWWCQPSCPECTACDPTSAVRRRARASPPPRWRTAVGALRCAICEASPRYAVCRRPAIAPAHPAKAQVRPQAAPKRSSTTRKANPAAVSKVASPSRTTVAFGECPPVCCSSLPPVHFPCQLDRITVSSSRFMLRMIATVVVSERRARRRQPGQAPRRVPACRDPVRSLFGFPPLRLR